MAGVTPLRINSHYGAPPQILGHLLINTPYKHRLAMGTYIIRHSHKTHSDDKDDDNDDSYSPSSASFTMIRSRSSITN